MNKMILIVGVALLAGAGYWWASRPPETQPAAMAGAGGLPASRQPAGNAETGESVAVSLPALEGASLRGQRAFGAYCARCHGPNAGGLAGKGPPLVHPYYRPGHHADQAIVMAARRGVTAHHWQFGNMPVIEGLTDAELRDIIAFIRAVQRNNGIS